MRVRHSLFVVLSVGLLAAGCSDDSGNNGSSDNIFSFNNLNPDMGMDATADAAADIGVMDAEVEMGVDMEMMEEDMGVDMNTPPPTDPTIMSLVPQTVVEPTDTRSFMVAVTLAEALEDDVRLTATDLPPGVTLNNASIRSGQTSATLNFSIAQATVEPARATVTIQATRLDENGMPTGEPASATLEVALTAPARLDTSGDPVFNTIVDPAATSIDITFDQPMEAANDTTFVVFSDMRGKLTGTYSGELTETLSFTPDGGFLADERLQIILRDLVTDQGDGLAQPISMLRFGPAAPATGFSATRAFAPGNVVPGPLVRLDLDADGFLDIAAFDASEAGDASNQICVNNGTGAVDCSEILPGVGVTAATSGDFNADGQIDFIVASGGATAVERLCINTDGTVAGISCNDAGVFTAGFANNLEVIDVDLDGLLDIVGTPATLDPTSTGERLAVCVNNGGTPPQFTCTESTSTTRSKVPGLVRAYDIDRDGSLDLLRTAVDPARTEICKASGARTYGCSTISSDPAVIGDIAAVSTSSSPFIFFSTGTGADKYDVTVGATGMVTVAKSAVPGLTGTFEALYLTDLTGDGREDGVATAATGQTFACANGGGSPPSLTCAEILPAIAGSTVATALVGDFDNDGIIDVVVNTDAGGSIIPGQ